MEAKSENDAIKKAKEMYMSGQQGEREEEFPILLKIFSVINWLSHGKNLRNRCLIMAF